MKEEGIAYVDVPHAFPDVVGSWTSAGFYGAFTSESDPRVLLEVPDAFREQAGCDKVQEARRDDEEYLQRRLVAALVNEVSDERASTKTTEDSEGERRCWQSETDACNETIPPSARSPSL
jgi:hypothetical protein